MDYNSPDTRNYVVGKAEIYFTPVGGVRRNMGNCPSAEIELTPERLDHFSARAGTRRKDYSVVVQLSGVVRINAEEFNRHNVRMALLGGALETNTEGDVTFPILAADAIRGRLEIIETHDIGPRWTYDFPAVSFAPSGPFSVISEEWRGVDLEGEIEAVNDNSGWATLQGSATTEPATEVTE